MTNSKTFSMAMRRRFYDDLLTHFSSHLKPEELKGKKDDAGMARILRQAPAQTILSAVIDPYGKTGTHHSALFQQTVRGPFDSKRTTRAA